MPRFFLINNIDKKGCTMCSSPLSPSREPPLVRSSHMLTEKLFADAIKPPAPRMGKWDMTPRWWRREEWLTVSNKQSCGSAPPPRCLSEGMSHWKCGNIWREIGKTPTSERPDLRHLRPTPTAYTFVKVWGGGGGGINVLAIPDDCRTLVTEIEEKLTSKIRPER